MLECEKCGSWFRDRYNLKQHMSRKTPCVAQNIKTPETSHEKIPKNSAFPAKNSAFLPNQMDDEA